MAVMRVIGPYRLLRALGRCEAGDVRSGYTADGTSVTVALVDSKRAGDTMGLGAWRGGAERLEAGGRESVVASMAGRGRGTGPRRRALGARRRPVPAHPVGRLRL